MRRRVPGAVDRIQRSAVDPDVLHGRRILEEKPGGPSFSAVFPSSSSLLLSSLEMSDAQVYAP